MNKDVIVIIDLSAELSLVTILKKYSANQQKQKTQQKKILFE